MSDQTPDFDPGKDKPSLAAILTPQGRGAIATIGILTPHAIDLVNRFFKPANNRPLTQVPTGRILFGKWRVTPDIMEELIIHFHSSDTLFVHCHGGAVPAAMILRSLKASGCQHTEWNIFASVSSSCDIEMAARIALASAQTSRTAAILMDQFHGALRRVLTRIQEHVLTKRYALAAGSMAALLRHAEFGLHLTKPWKVVVMGAPNVGKSSLVNAIVGFQRSIVFNEPGTTRDVVSASTAIDGWPIEINDTAGIRVSSDPIEAEGIAGAKQHAEKADLILFVSDPNSPWDGEKKRHTVHTPKSILVQNKSDLQTSQLSTAPNQILTSAVTGEGISDLIQQIADLLVPFPPARGSAIPFEESHLETLRNANTHLEKQRPSQAANCLAELLASSGHAPAKA